MTKNRKGILGALSALACALVLVLASVAPALAATTTGSITITSDANSTSTLYRVIDITWGGTATEAPTYTWNSGVATWLKGNGYDNYVGDNNVVTDKFNVKDAGNGADANPDLTDGANAAAQFYSKLAAAVTSGDPQLTAAATLENGKTQNNLTFGSYLIITTNKANASTQDIRVYNPTVATLGPTENGGNWAVPNDQGAINVTIKSSTPTISKSQQVGSETDDVNGIGVGKQVTYTLTATVPSYPSTTADGDKIFRIVDTMTKGLQFNKESVVIKNAVGTVLYDAQNISAFDVSSTGSASDATGTTATFAVNDFDTTLKPLANQVVTVTYTATVTKDAVVSSDGMVNGATLHYGHDYTVDSGKPKLYTFGLNVYKHGDDGTGDKALSGAQFELYTTKADGSADAKINVSANADGTYYVDASGTAALTSGTDGHFKVYGLDEGTYVLRETVAPTGFQKLQEDIKVTVTAAKNGDSMNGDVVVGQNVTSHDYGYLPVDVKNTKGFSLPTTGGAGTLVLTAAGVVLLGGALLLMIRLRRQD